MSKDLFMEQRAYEVALSSGQISKMVMAEKVSEVKTALENGELNPKITAVQAKLLEDFSKEVLKISKERFEDLEVSDLPSNFSGIKFSTRAGYEILDYEKDAVYSEILKKLKAREGALKAAYSHNRNLGGVMTDDDGEIIPVVPVKSVVAPSMSISY
jgi:hypothetical protein